jgi:putative ABC transport system permease protein
MARFLTGQTQALRRRPRWVPVARRNLLAEKARLAISVCGVAAAVLLILIVTSLYRGWSGAGGVFAELPGDVWLAQAGTSDPLRTPSFLPADRLDDLSRVPGVREVIPVYARRVALSQNGRDLNVLFMALAAPSAEAWPAEVRVRFLPEKGHVTIDGVFAREAGVGVGDEISVLGRRLVVQHVDPGGNPLFETAFLNSADAADLLRVDGFVNFFVLVAEPGVDGAQLSPRAVAAVPGSQARTAGQFAAATREMVHQGFLPVVGVLVAIGFAIGGAVIALTIYTATVEKARDFGVLKAIGASEGFVYGIVVRQSLSIGVVGAALGVGASVVVATLVRDRVPEFVTDLRPWDATGVFAGALLVSALAALVPVRRISRIDPATVFRA